MGMRLQIKHIHIRSGLNLSKQQNKLKSKNPEWKQIIDKNLDL